MTGDGKTVVDLGAHMRAKAAAELEPDTARIELVEVAVAGILVRHAVRWVEADGTILGTTTTHPTPDGAADAFQRILEVLGSAWDEESGSYNLTRVRVDQSGARVPIPTEEQRP